ncbi:unnamed protein product [Prunus armeniaca]|uniref:Uncharacterized protein n=1 Tax=Prunus armeniaca TaxID=36596 RepID=A0A6J5TMV2_PRUAR|nr:unnamed protein product [Prunus armeniaca]
MSGWNRPSRPRLGRNSNSQPERTSTVRLGRVQPQAPGHRTIFCNDREANLPVRFPGYKSANTAHEKGFNFDDAKLMRGAWRNEPNPDLCKVDFVSC